MCKMKQIKLTQGRVALVDDIDYKRLSKYKWQVLNDKGNFRAIRRTSRKKGKRHTIYMAREILGLAYGDLRQGDHKDHNTLDNRRDNIRICTNQQNTFNQKSILNTSSRFKGVSWHNPNEKWQARIQINGKEKYLGCFNNEEMAALAYNLAARKHYGEFACLNPI